MQSFAPRSLRHQPKTQEICVRLTEMAHMLGPESKLPTVLELRDQMGVSLRTLDNAMKILEAGNIIYRIQGVGVFVSPSLQRHVSLVCTPDFFQESASSPFWQLMVGCAGERAKEKKEAFSCHFTVPGGHRGAPLHAGLAREIEARELHGLLGIGLDEETADWIEARDIPFVAFAGPARWTVGVDTFNLLEIGVQELTFLGCKRLSLWSPGSPIGRPVVEVHEALLDSKWQELLEGYGLVVEDGLLRNQSYEHRVGQSHQEQGFELAHEVFCAPRASWPDGILCRDDLMTHGLLLAMEKLGVRVGKDVHIVSHANRKSTVLMGREHLLTRLEYDPAEIARTMFDILETVIDGGHYEEGTTLVRPSLHRPS